MKVCYIFKCRESEILCTNFGKILKRIQFTKSLAGGLLRGLDCLRLQGVGRATLFDVGTALDGGSKLDSNLERSKASNLEVLSFLELSRSSNVRVQW